MMLLLKLTVRNQLKTDIQTNLYSHSIGDTIKVTFYRGKEKKTEELKLTKSTEDLSD